MGSALPPPLMTSEPGSFARHTIVERKPQILAKVAADNAYPAEVCGALEAFAEEIARGCIAPLREDAEDTTFWNEAWRAYAGRTWLELPWYFAETYFYRRLLEAVRYLRPGPWQGVDPFAPQKRAQEAQALAQIGPAWGEIAALEVGKRFEVLLHAGLWGNRADLSNFTVKAQAHDGLSTATERHLILIDDTERVRALLAGSGMHLAFVCDNVGADSLFDMALADFLLEEGWATRVDLHLKDRPFFVSDAMPADIELMIGQMAASRAVATLGERLQAALGAGRLRLRTDAFWSRCLAFDAMPEGLREEIGQARLTIVKGDVNYRRLLDDRHWPPETRMEDAASFPAPSFLVSRTLKGEIIVGLKPGQAEALTAEDPTWMINGRRGLLQLVGG